MDIFFRAKRKISPKAPSEFCSNLAGFKKCVYKFKWSLPLKDNFRAVTLVSLLTMLCFSLWFFLSAVVLNVTASLSLESRFCFQSPLDKQVFILVRSRVREAGESSGPKRKILEPMCSFKVFCKVRSWHGGKPKLWGFLLRVIFCGTWSFIPTLT